MQGGGEDDPLPPPCPVADKELGEWLLLFPELFELLPFALFPSEDLESLSGLLLSRFHHILEDCVRNRKPVPP